MISLDKNVIDGIIKDVINNFIGQLYPPKGGCLSKG